MHWVWSGRSSLLLSGWSESLAWSCVSRGGGAIGILSSEASPSERRSCGSFVRGGDVLLVPSSFGCGCGDAGVCVDRWLAWCRRGCGVAGCVVIRVTWYGAVVAGCLIAHTPTTTHDLCRAALPSATDVRSRPRRRLALGRDPTSQDVGRSSWRDRSNRLRQVDRDPPAPRLLLDGPLVVRLAVGLGLTRDRCGSPTSSARQRTGGATSSAYTGALGKRGFWN